MADIGAKIKLEGEAEFRSQMKDLTQQSKTLQSEMKKVVSEFTEETTAQEKAAAKSKVLTEQIKVQQDKVKLLADQYQKAAKELGENDNKTLKLKEQLNKAETALNQMNHELDATEKEANEYETEIGEATEANSQFTQSIGQLMGNEKLQEFFSSASQKIAEFASSAMEAAKELDEGYDTIATKTGATGDSLEELKGIANDVYGSMPVEMADVGSAVGEVSTRFKQSGDQLRETSEQFLKFARINGTDVSDSIDSVDRVMKTFHVDASQTENVLGLLTSAAQSSGIKMDALTSQLDQNGATFAELGFSVQDAAEMLAMFEANGVDTSTTMTALKKSITNAAKEGKDANSVLKDAEARIKGASSETEALQIATDIFGTRGAVVMVNGLRDGRISLERTTKSLESYKDVVGDTFEATLSPWDKTKTAMNNLKTVASDLAGNALSTLVPAIEKVTEVIQKVSDWFQRLSPSAQKVIGVFTAITAAAAIVGPKVMAVVTTLKELKAASDLTKSLKGMSDEMNNASGSASGLTKEIGLWGGAIALAIGSVVAITEAQTAWRLKTDENYASLVKLAEENEKLANEASYSRTSLDQLTTSYYGNSEEIDRLTDRLITLNEKQNLTAEESAEYRTTVEKLAALLPGFSSEIDTSTGKLKDQSQATRENVEALKLMAQAAAAQNGLEQAIQASTEAEVKQQQALDNMREALARAGSTMELTDEQLIEYARNVHKTDGFMGTLMDSTNGASQMFRQVANDLADGVIAYDEYGTQMADADALINRYTADIDAAANSASNLQATTAESMAGVAESVTAAAPAVESAAGNLGSRLTSALSGSKTKSSATESGKAVTVSMATGLISAIPRLVTAISNMQKPVKNIPLALRSVQPAAQSAGMAIPASIASGMTGGTGLVSSAATTLGNAAKVNINASSYSAQGRSIAQGIASGITSNTSVVSAASNALKNKVGDGWSVNNFTHLGAMIDAGIAKGMNNNLAVVRNAATNVAAKAIQAAKDRLKVGSPSKEFEYLGKMSVAGYLGGIENGGVAKAINRTFTLPDAGAAGGVSNSYSSSYGDIVVNVSGANVSDPARLADMVADRINRQVLSRKAAFA